MTPFCFCHAFLLAYPCFMAAKSHRYPQPPCGASVWIVVYSKLNVARKWRKPRKHRAKTQVKNERNVYIAKLMWREMFL